MSEMQMPSVGRIVHYVSYGSPIKQDGSQTFKSQCRAAIVTIVNNNSVGLAILNPTGMFFGIDFEYSAPSASSGPFGDSKPVGGSWHWPERV